jgi:predicted TIM-barrel fold metal-dependent hydrolase
MRRRFPLRSVLAAPMLVLLALAGTVLAALPALAQEPPAGDAEAASAPVCEELPYARPVREDLEVQPGMVVPWFYEYDPPPTLVVEENPTPRAKYPFVDVHNHQGRMAGYSEEEWAELVAAMDEMNMAVMVNLSGRGFRRIERPDGTTGFGFGGTDTVAAGIEASEAHADGRVVVFTNLDTSELGTEGWAEVAVAQLEADVAAGARGLKIYKSLGMGSTDANGERIAVDDPRLDPVWAKCGELGVPVLIHSADPAPFWQSRDGDNERLLELMERAGRYQGDGENPPFEEILAEQHRMFRKHPETIFINAHLGWMGNDLGRLGELLDELPNVYTEIGAVLAELGRQPRAARAFLIEHQDRVLFGKDSWHPSEYPVYFRVLETADEYFDYYRRRHAFWKMYGLDLPDDVLKKIYYANALEIIPGLDPSLFPSVP